MLLCPLSGSYLVLHVFLLSLSFFCPQRSCFTVVFRLFLEVLFSSCSSSDSSQAGFCKRPIFTKVFGAAFLPQGSHVLILLPGFLTVLLKWMVWRWHCKLWCRTFNYSICNEYQYIKQSFKQHLTGLFFFESWFSRVWSHPTCLWKWHKEQLASKEVSGKISSSH